jgi:hypothetical protein
MVGIVSSKIGAAMAAQVARVNEVETELDPADPRNQPARPRGTPMPLAATLGAPPPVTIPLKLVGTNVPPQRQADPQQIIAQQADEILRLKATITRQNARIAKLEEAAETPQAAERPAVRSLTPLDAHKRTGISLSMISRYCATGWWVASKDDTGHWHIDADQDLARKTRKNKKG